MRHFLLTYQTHPMINIGDYIQSLAAKQFLDDSYSLVERDELNKIPFKESAKLIMNGWFTYKPLNWPPAANIDPLFVAFHLNQTCRDSFFTSKTISYLKKHEPIGCRDENTMNCLKEHGISAYFSGCLTLTLGETYQSLEKDNTIYIVDPLSYLPENNSLKQVVLSLFYIIWYIRPVLFMMKRLKKENPIRFSLSKIGIGRFLLWGRAYVYLRKLVDKDLLRKAHYVTHIYGNDELASDDERFMRAETLIKMYAKASLVITSRIHSALPCLGLGTPVLFVKSTDDSEKSLCRFQGLEDFFNEIEVSEDKVVTPKNFKITTETRICNKLHYLRYKKDLVEKCKSFIYGK